MKTTALLCGALLLTLGSGVHAQAPSGAPKQQRFDCSRAKDPKACEERLAKARAARAKARAACEGKQGEERRACMRHELCAQSGDPAKCEENAKRRAAEGARLREACKDRKGDELRSCIRDQRRKK